MRILYVLHADFEPPCIIEDWATKKGFSQSFAHPFVGDQLPADESFDMLVIMGGPQSPLELDKYPYLKGEIELAAKAIKKDKVVLGFCLGAQIIGEALGARTERSPHKEVGIYPITLNKAGQEDPILKGLPKQFPVVHWHNDMPGVPQGAKILAASEGCPRQIICFGEKVYGFQCHLEPKKSNIEAMIEHGSDDLKPGRYVQTAAELHEGDYNTINSHMIRILENLLRKANYKLKTGS